MSLTKVTYSMISGAVANALDFGAVGNGVTDDTAAIQAAIDFIGVNSPVGGIVYLPKGLYLTSATLDLDYDNVQLIGEGTGVNHNTGSTVTQDGPTQIIGGHVNGAVVRIWNRGCSIKNLVVSSTATRRAATSGTNVYGIWVETVDTTLGNSNGPWRINLDYVHVTKQPSHGIVMIGNVIMSAITFSDIDNCNGHGVVIDCGTITGRTNKARPGQVNLYSIRSSRTDGCAFYLGNAFDGSGTTNLIYRIDANMLECFFNLQNSAVYNADGKQGSITGFMENCAFQSCATNGNNANNGINITGTFNLITNHRFVNCEPYCAYIDDYGSAYRTTDVKFNTLYINNLTQPPGYYNPAIYVANTNIRNISVNANIWFSAVTSLLDTTLSLYPDTSFKTRKEFKGLSISNFKSWANFTLNNNQAGYFDFDIVNGRQGIISIGGNLSSAESGMATYRIGDASAFCSLLNGTTNFVVTTGALTGTTGGAGKLTVSADTASNRIYVENRTGAAKAYVITNLSALSIIQNFTLV